MLSPFEICFKKNFVLFFPLPSLFKFLTDSLLHLHTKYCLSVVLIQRISLVFINPQTKYIYLTTNFLFVYKLCLQLLVCTVLCFSTSVIFLSLSVYLIFHLWCSGLFCMIRVRCVQFYLKKVSPASFLWLGQVSNDNQNNII